MTPADIGEARRVIEAATKAPWCASSSVRSPDDSSYVYRGANQLSRLGQIARISRLGENGHDDARFIAAARTGWPAALDEVERLAGSGLAALASAHEISIADCAVELVKNLTDAKSLVASLTAERDAMRAVVEAASVWRETWNVHGVEMIRDVAETDLADAVDALRASKAGGG